MSEADDFENQDIKIPLSEYRHFIEQEQQFFNLAFFLRIHIDGNKQIDLKELSALLRSMNFSISYNWGEIKGKLNEEV